MPVLPYPVLQPLQAPLLRPDQAMGGHCIPALGETAASSPTDVPPGQPAGVVQSSLERKAVGSAEYRILSGTNGGPVRALSDGAGLFA